MRKEAAAMENPITSTAHLKPVCLDLNSLWNCKKMSLHSDAAAAQHEDDQRPIQQAEIRCFCILCVLQTTLPHAKMDLWHLVCLVTCLQVTTRCLQKQGSPVNSACYVCPAQALVHKVSLQHEVALYHALSH